MAITTGGGVAFDEGASVRNAGAMTADTVQQYNQRKQFQQKQALDVGTQMFYQAMQSAQMSGNPEAYLGSGEGAKLLSEAGAAFSAAMGRKLNPDEVQQTGLAALSQYVAANTSTGSQAQSKAAEMMRRGLLGGPGATPVTPNTQDNTVRAGSDVDSIAQAQAQASAGGVAGAGWPGGVDPGAQSTLVPNVISQGYSAAPEAPVSTAYTDMYGAPPIVQAAPAQTTTEQDAQELARAQAIRAAQPIGSKPPAEALEVSNIPGDPTALQIWSLKAVPRKAEENSQEYQMRRQKWENAFVKINSMRSPFDPLDPNRDYAIPGGAEQLGYTDEAPASAEFQSAEPGRGLVQRGRIAQDNSEPSSYQSLLQGIGSSRNPIDILNQGLVGSDRSAAQAASPSGASGLTRSSVDAEDLAKGSYVPPSSGTLLPNKVPVSPPSEPVLKPGTKLKLDALAQGIPELKPSTTPKIDLATMRVAKAKIENAFDYSAEAISKMSNGKTPDQRTKAQALEVVKRVKAPHEEYKAMTDDALKASYKDTVAWYNSASPAELEAAGMSGVAGRTETMQIAKIQAQAAVDAAAARAGGDKESAWLEYKAKLLDRASTVTEQLQKLAATDKTTFFEAAKKYDFMAKTWSAYMSEAYGMPLDLNIMEQKRNLWEFISGAPKKQQIVIGGSSSNANSPAKAPDTSLDSKYYSTK